MRRLRVRVPPGPRRRTHDHRISSSTRRHTDGCQSYGWHDVVTTVVWRLGGVNNPKTKLKPVIHMHLRPYVRSAAVEDVRLLNDVLFVKGFNAEPNERERYRQEGRTEQEIDRLIGPERITAQEIIASGRGT